MSDVSRSIVPVGKHEIVASVNRQIKITEKLVASILDKDGTSVLAAGSELIESAICTDPQTGFTDSLTGMEFVYVKGGTFIMGDTFSDGSDGYNAHQVTVSDFCIGRYQVTQGEWQAVMGSNPSYFTDGGASCPVEQVSWDDVQVFISKLNQRSDKNYRLPTEAEWEYAARSGGKSERYSGGNDIDAVAWYNDNSGSRTHSVRQKLANGLGLNDMSGNVYEWVNDWYDSYSSASQTNPAGPLSGSARVFRGGCWGAGASIVRTSIRGHGTPDIRDDIIGFRLAAPVELLNSLTAEIAEIAEVSADAVSVTAADTGIAESLIYTDPQSGLMWPRNGNIAGVKMNWDDAMNWVKTLNYAGYSDWRLPSIDELDDIPSEWLNNNGFNNVQAGWYWTGTENDSGNAFIVGMEDWSVGNYSYKCVDYYVWPVRSEL